MSTTPSLTINTSNGNYPIIIGNDLLGDADLLAPYLGPQVLIISNESVAEHYLAAVEMLCRGSACASLVLPDGEVSKSADSLQHIYHALLERNYSRDCTLVALGGGVVGDITGFAAATYQRGVDYLQIPTTLLAQVDSSVGGKTAINHPLGKNMIGAFHPPRAVFIDMQTLSTLPDRELRSGLAEVLKYGLMADADLFAWIEANTNALLARDPQALSHVVQRSCAIKAEIVQVDEDERTGERILLNLGHTFAHAIETWQEYRDWLHGEAVAVGLVMAADFSMRSARLSAALAQRIRAAVEALDLPTTPPSGLPPKEFMELMAKDKKNIGGVPRLVVLNALGSAELISKPDPEILLQTLSAAENLTHD